MLVTGLLFNNCMGWCYKRIVFVVMVWIVGYPLDSGLSQRVLNKKGFPYSNCPIHSVKPAWERHNGSIFSPWPTHSSKKQLRSWRRLLPRGARRICTQSCNDCVRPTSQRSPHASRFGRTHPTICSQCYMHGSVIQRVSPLPSDKRMTGRSTYPMLTSGYGWKASPPPRVWW